MSVSRENMIRAAVHAACETEKNISATVSAEVDAAPILVSRARYAALLQFATWAAQREYSDNPQVTDEAKDTFWNNSLHAATAALNIR